MNFNNQISTISVLKKKLTELAWQVKRIDFTYANIPPGLFKTKNITTPTAYVEEIENDLVILEKFQYQIVSIFLAKKIFQKIAILVALCSNYQNKDNNSTMVEDFFVTNKIQNRQQWLQKAKPEISALLCQQRALQQRLEEIDPQQFADVCYQIEKDLTIINKTIINLKTLFGDE